MRTRLTHTPHASHTSHTTRTRARALSLPPSLGALPIPPRRRITDCGDNGPQHDIVLRRSEDLGASWGPLIVVRKGKTPCPDCPAAVSNPNPVEITFGDGSRKVLLHFDTMNNPRMDHHGLDMQVWSDDDGLTWVNPTVLVYPPQPNLGGLIGPSVGIQSASGTIYFNQVSPNGNKTLYWSKDYGVTWASSRPLSGLSECSIAFVDDSGVGDILMNCRVGGGRRAQIIWGADGVPGPITYPEGLIDPNCQGSLINHRNTLLFSNANTTTSRTHMAVKASVDGGASWDRGVSIWDGPSAYSQLVSLGVNGVGLLFEAGFKSPYETISYVAVPAKHQ